MTELFTTNVLITAASYNHNDLIFDTNTVHTTANFTSQVENA